MNRRAQHGIVVLLFSLMLMGCGREAPDTVTSRAKVHSPSMQVNRGGEAKYIGSNKCQACHRDIYDQYFGTHPMGRSVLNMKDDAHFAFETGAEFQVGHVTYGVRKTNDGGLAHYERLVDDDGVVYEQTVAMDLGIGSGSRGYTFGYLKNGSVYQSPLTWYSQSSRWDLSPGYNPEGHPGFGRQISGDCLFCHTGSPKLDPQSPHRVLEGVFAEASIGCERCHGPGGDHAAFHGGSRSGMKTDPVLDLSSLAPKKRDSICYQCHLHGVDRVPNAGHSSFDFRPGDSISDVWVTFVNEVAGDNSQSKAVSHVEQMVTSQCYLKSGGNFGCVSCHSPHSKPALENRETFYRSRCLKCHGEQSGGCTEPLQQRLDVSTLDSCIYCHMPSSLASDVPHTAQTDHRILRRYSSGNSGAQSKRNLEVFEPGLFDYSQAAVQRAFGLYLEKTADSLIEVQEALRLLEPSIESERDHEAMAAVAWLYLRLGNANGAAALCQRILDKNDMHSSAHKTLAVIREAEGKLEEANFHSARAQELEPGNIQLLSQRARVLQALGKMEDAVALIDEAIETQPGNIELRKRLVELLKRNQQDQRSQEAAQTLERIQRAKSSADE